MNSIEKMIFSNLIHNEEYTRKTLPFLKEEYFQDSVDRKIFDLIKEYVDKYNKSPTSQALLIELANSKGLNDDQYATAEKEISDFEVNKLDSLEWLVDRTEGFCKDRAIFNAISKSLQILNDKVADISKGSIPQLLSDALSVSFDPSIGHDFIDDYESRFDFYNSEVSRIPFDLSLLNKITNGGLPKKTLTILMAPSGLGKSLWLCHLASAHMMMGYNVLYITLEMSEEKIAERIDANLLDIDISKLNETPKELFSNKVNTLKKKTTGKLVIKEYPTASASAANFRYLINELKIKKNFIPDVVYIDYLNICASSRIKMNSGSNSYNIVKSICEEIRGLAIEVDVPLITATQTNRSGLNNSDPELDNISDSFGTVMSADLLLALSATEDLVQLNQIQVKQLKNRYNDLNYYKKFVVGVDKSKMRLYDIDNPQFGLLDAGTNDDDVKQKMKGFK